MPDQASGPAMSQKIFSMNLDVETVSLYLLCCAVTDAGAPITIDTLADKWNGGLNRLKQGLRHLEQRNIICRREEGEEASPTYRIVDEESWV
jgi:predicted transcriptional regulator